MLNLHPERKYDVLDAPWGLRGDPPSTSGSVGQEEHRFKLCEANARSLAEEFWGDYRDVVRNAVLRGHKGKIGVEEWIEAQMGRREKERAKEWGVDGAWDAGRGGWGGEREEDWIL
jgi:hypothetical protein